MLALGNSYITEGKYAQGEALEQQALDIARRTFGPEHPLTIVAASELAVALRREKKYGRAETLDRQVLDIERRTLGPDHPFTVGSMSKAWSP